MLTASTDSACRHLRTSTRINVDLPSEASRVKHHHPDVFWQGSKDVIVQSSNAAAFGGFCEEIGERRLPLCNIGFLQFFQVNQLLLLQSIRPE
jgi:hypothetical protein